ncbi:MAG: caspase family protein [Bacteroides sp.]|nr:caspase family protein [Bacteroides sp.]
MVSGLFCQSQTLHAIIFANTECPDPNDHGIGASVTGDYYRMKIEMSTIASFIGYDLKTHYYTGSQDQFCKESLDKVIDNLKCGPDDIVFFYYSGHGGRSAAELTDFPQMNLVVDPYHSNLSDASANYPIYNVMKRIEAKNPRLTIVIGDLCNSIAEWVAPKALPSDKSATKVEEYPVEFYRDLFLKFKGSLIAASSKPGQTSAAYEDGGAFTIALMQVLQLMVAEKWEPSWTKLLEGTVYVTNKCSNGKQTPIYDSSNLHHIDHIAASNQNTSIADNTQPPVQDTPSGTTGGSDNTAGNENWLSDLLTGIGNDAVSLEKRIEATSETLRIIFESPQAKINVVGRDGKTIVSTKTAKDYLNWLTVTTNLYKVIPIKGTLGPNKKLSFLQVHEMYK